MNVFGERLNISLFGESHGPAIGVVLDGLPAGIKIRMKEIKEALRRRRPGFSALTSTRVEADEPEVFSGMLCGRTTGAPLAIVIRNRDARPQDYAPLRHVPRPGHADLGAWFRFGDWRDWRGGGHFSGRMTAPLVAAGAVTMMMPWMTGIRIVAHTVQIAKISLPDSAHRSLHRQMDSSPLKTLSRVRKAVLRAAAGCVDRETEQAMVAAIRSAAQDGDSVGGVVECVAVGVPPGLGSLPFEGVEPVIARLILSIPAVKGIEFGAGFAGAAMRGSEHNDPIVWTADTGRSPLAYARGSDSSRRNAQPADMVIPRTLTSNAGGVLGGITTGTPIVFRVAFKPTPSIAIPQQTVDLRAGRVIKRTGRIPAWANRTLCLKGRHDPCIVPRALAVVEACAALAIANLALP